MQIENTVRIHAPAAKVWDALTNPAETKKYMFGCEALSDWKPASPLLWKGTFNGVQMVAVKGTIADIRPGVFLAYTTIDPNSGMEDKPENYLTVTYDLKESGGYTTLTVTQGDYSKVADGRRRYDEAVAGGGWSSILEAIRKLVEG